MKVYLMYGICSTTDQFEQHRHISGVIQNSRYIVFRQERYMQGKIW